MMCGRRLKNWAWSNSAPWRDLLPGASLLKPLASPAIGPIGARAEPLRDDAFQAHLAGVLKHGQPAVVLQVLVQAHAVPCLAQDTSECRFANLDRLPPHVGAV